VKSIGYSARGTRKGSIVGIVKSVEGGVENKKALAGCPEEERLQVRNIQPGQRPTNRNE